MSGPEALTYPQVAEKITSAAGRKVSYVDFPPEQLKQGLVGAGVPDAYADAMLDLHAFHKRGEGSAVTGNVRRIAGRDPIRFDQYAKDYAKEFRS